MFTEECLVCYVDLIYLEVVMLDFCFFSKKKTEAKVLVANFLLVCKQTTLWYLSPANPPSLAKLNN